MHRSLPARFGLVCGLAASALAFAGPVRAEEGVGFKNILGSIGILPEDKDPIRYRERAPLVIPRSTGQLPAPAGPESYASSNPQWPNDPDVARKRRRADEERRPVTWSESRRSNDNGGVLLTNREMTAGRTGNAATGSGPSLSHRGDSARDVLYVSPDQLRARPPAEKEANAGPEPVRRVLSDPPTGMRRSSTGQAVAGDFAPRVDEQARDANPMNWLTRKLKGQNDDDD